MKTPDVSRIAEFTEEYNSDKPKIDRVTSQFREYRITLEEICQKELTPKRFSRLLSVYDEVANSLDIPKRYENYADILKHHALKEKENLDKLTQLENLLLQTVNLTYESISKKWEEQKTKILDWKEDYGLEDLKQLRSGLDYAAHTYQELISTFGGRVKLDRMEDVVDYLKFRFRIEKIEPEFSEINEKYSRRQELSLQELNALVRDLDHISEKYRNAENVQSPLKRIFSKNPLLNHRERFLEIENYKSELYELIAQLSEPKKQVEEEQVSAENQASPEETPSDIEVITKTVGDMANRQMKRLDQQERIESAHETIDMMTEPDLPPMTPLAKEETTSGIAYRQIIRNQSNYFDVVNHLLVIGFPPLKYMKLMDIMLGKTSEKHWVNRLEALSIQLAKTPLAASLDELDYAYQLEYSIREDMNRGNIDSLISRNPNYWETANSALSGLNAYIQKSEETLRLSQEMVNAHQALSGPKNRYNRMLA